MFNRKVSLALAGLAGLWTLSGLAGAADVQININAGVREQPVVVHEVRRAPWAPSEGYRHSIAYRYYPAREIYYNPFEDEYYCYVEGRWLVREWLPDSWRNSLDDYIIIDLEGNDPRPYHRLIAREYPRRYFVNHRGSPDHRDTRWHRHAWDNHRRDNDRHDRDNRNWRDHDRRDNDRNDHDRRENNVRDNDRRDNVRQDNDRSRNDQGVRREIRNPQIQRPVARESRPANNPTRDRESNRAGSVGQTRRTSTPGHGPSRR